MSKAKVVYNDGENRIVLVEWDRYILEQKNGEDAMGVERWDEVGMVRLFPGPTDNGRGVDIPRPLFRGLMKIVCKVVEGESKLIERNGKEVE